MGLPKNRPRVSVCQLFGYYNHGGITGVVTELSLQLRGDFSITTVCRKALRRPQEGLNVVELNPKNTLDLWAKLGRLQDFDIIHCHDVYALPGLVRSRATGPKVIYTHHGIVPWRYTPTGDRPGWLLAYICARYAIPRVGLSVALSDYTLRDLQGRYGGKRLAKIPNGVNTKEFSPAMRQDPASELKGEPVLLYVGLMERHKGLEFLVRSMPRVLERFPQALLVVVGTGRDEAYLRRLSVTEGLDGKVVFTGFLGREELVGRYNASDIHVEPAYWHSFGLPIIEAMACGKPVIARDAYAMREHIVASGGGALFMQDDARQLVSAIETIMGDYDTYSSAARTYAQRFSREVMATEYAGAYLSMMEQADE